VDSKGLGEVTMKKLEWITGLGLVALLLVSCNSDVSQAPTPQPSVKPLSPSPQPVATTSPQETKVSQVPQGLVSATNPAKINITTGRSDPFRTVAIPSIKLPVSPEGTKQGKTNPNPNNQGKTNPNPTIPNPNNRGKTNPNPANPNLNNRSKTNPNPTNPNLNNRSKTNPNLANPNPNNRGKTNPNPTNPNPNNPNQNNVGKTNQGNTNIPNEEIAIKTPSTSLASAIEVTGVVQVGGQVSAIVKESNDKTSRYVSTGEYLSNGAVLVKRIQIDSNKEPVVILEQNGVEVVKPVSSTSGSVASLQ
jgi:hypothetical protein